MTDPNAKNATLKTHLKTDSGMTSKGESRVSVKQWQAICAAEAGHDMAVQMLASGELLEALKAVAPYLNTMLVDDDEDSATIGWQQDPDTGEQREIDFTMGHIRRVNAAIAKAEGK